MRSSCLASLRTETEASFPVEATMPAATFALRLKKSQVDTRTETAGRRSRQQYEDLVESLEAIVWRANAHTFEHVYVSEQAETVLGYPVNDWLRQPHFKETHLHPDDRMQVLATYRQAAHDPLHHLRDYCLTGRAG